MRLLLPLALLLAQSASGPTHLTPVFTTQGQGVQIYSCTQAGGAYAWTLQAPQATLTDTRTHLRVATHSAGPTWTWNDGSALTGTVLEKTPSPDPASIPFLTLEAHPSGSKGGALTGITRITRTNTHGGNPPPTGCDAAHVNASTRVPYTATYTFFR